MGSFQRLSKDVLPSQNGIPDLGELVDLDYASFVSVIKRFRDLRAFKKIKGKLLAVQQNCINLTTAYVKAVSKSVFQVLTLSQIEGAKNEYLPTMFLNTAVHDFTFDELDFFREKIPTHKDVKQAIYPDFLLIKDSRPKRRSESSILDDERPSLAQAELLKVFFEVLVESNKNGKFKKFPLNSS